MFIFFLFLYLALTYINSFNFVFRVNKLFCLININHSVKEINNFSIIILQIKFLKAFIKLKSFSEIIFSREVIFIFIYILKNKSLACLYHITLEIKIKINWMQCVNDKTLTGHTQCSYHIARGCVLYNIWNLNRSINWVITIFQYLAAYLENIDFSVNWEISVTQFVI